MTIRSFSSARKKSAFPADIIVGAVVKMRSGGAMMTITSLLEGAPLAVLCEWHDANFYPHEKTIPVACLRLLREAEVEEELQDEDEDE